MKTRELENIGFESKETLGFARSACAAAAQNGYNKKEIRNDLKSVSLSPSLYLDHPVYGELARAIMSEPKDPNKYHYREVKYATFGEEIEPDAHKQMENACKLPIAFKGALMPDAHVGYGLPVGGVLATEGAVIPYAVGVDIACRVMITAFDIPTKAMGQDPTKFAKAIEENTQFGVGAKWKRRKEHPVLDENWKVTPITASVRETAWSQLGTSGSGNHFVEFGELELLEQFEGVPAGRYLALVSHSGSRGAGAQIAAHFSALAQKLHKQLPGPLKHLAWLPMEGEGAEYWAAMELMGKYASANHHLIHQDVGKAIGGKPLLQVENHHNFAWKETHDGEEVIVHRKGATPAGKGVRGYIPGTMVNPGYLVEGLGDETSLLSASHGAGRLMSRKQAKNSVTRSALNKLLEEARVKLLSAGLDESPHAYKDIDKVMSAQRDLVRTLGKFTPKIVKMAPEGERAED